jgi:hypothetical protein
MSNVINKTAAKWTNEELAKWGLGEVETGPNISVKAVAKEAAARFGLEDGEVDEIRAQIAAEATESTVSEEEVLEKGARGLTATNVPVDESPFIEEEGATVQTDAEGNQAVVFTQKPFDLNKNIAPTPDTVQGAGIKLTAGRTAADVKEAAAKAREGLSLKVVESGLKEYIDKMYPGVPHSGEDGPKAQVAFFRIIQNIFRLKGSDFVQAYSLLLDTVAAHRSKTFNERYVFRYMSDVRLSVQERKNFERIVNLLLVTCNKTTRKQTMQQVDLPTTVEGFSDPELIQKLTEFYSM